MNSERQSKKKVGGKKTIKVCVVLGVVLGGLNSFDIGGLHVKLLLLITGIQAIFLMHTPNAHR